MALLLRLLLAALSGVCFFASFEPLGWWIAGIVSALLLILSLMPWTSDRLPERLRRPLRGRGGMLIAAVQALVAYLCLLPWVGEFVGPLPYVALAVVLSLYSLLLGGAGARLLHRRGGLLGFVFLYVVVEWLRSSWPFGGFAWVRLAWGQIDGPLAALARWGGPSLVTFATIALAAACIALYRALASRGGSLLPAILSILLIVGSAGWCGLQLNAPEHTTGRTTVGAVQGNVPRMGLDFNAQRRAVLANHVRETEAIDEPVDFLVWPENSVDVNPLVDRAAGEMLQEALDAVKVPILIGTITVDEVGDRNTMLVMDPEKGPVDKHIKKYLQPFGEYMPMRSFLRHFSPYVDRAGNFQPGDGDGVVDIAGVRLGIMTCYEVAFDQAGRDAILHGATLLATPTNNATFGFTDMSYQQLAMSRMRAIELDRAVVVSATSGVSAMVEPDGTVTQHTHIFEPRHLVAEMPLRDTITMAARYGFIIDITMVIIGTLFMAWAFVPHRGASLDQGHAAPSRSTRKKRK
ncbi:apolipoprotein N-acyltransferase [Corynebacterium uropygiale]|uniref:Apolipoprotein N-acyltransferase n=1 Tax=Corynebacterium uropygiale TaxID=1775911 RepID=A0A9X1TZ99_9CORY|nr:apolipoprotein N-acyltransferase [Corynebacterium uropygiale]